MSAPFRQHWSLDPEVRFLNHGSFGACPTAVLQRQSELRARLEAEPVRFLHREVEPLLDEARAALAAFLDADADDLAFVTNATTGVNTVLRSLRFAPGDELLTTDHEYNASRNALEFAASRWGAKVVVAKLPWPVPSAQAVVDTVLAHVTPRTRLLLVDHVSSQTAVVMPVARLISVLRERGVETLVDGAHGPGMVPLSLRSLGAGYYTGNCHKWLCAPKGAAFLHVRGDLQAGIKPLVISHGHNSPRTDRSRFRLDFDWLGTHDPSAVLCVPHALKVVGGLLPGGWPAVMEANREKALAARKLLCERLGVEPACPEDMVGSMAVVGLPDGYPERPEPPLYLDPLQLRLFDEHRIEVPIIPWPKAPRRHVRVSAQLYNTHAEYQALAEALDAQPR
ncbi:aminotransferase class V-fold PLP-dependent enzyme [Myxococcus sp. RHSTA-1-4]|uniref:aminotransferase class V-fold PLP-dependent enzyme n=1 Tax=Myxococcus sp. RHSTA-1-4 TaxID=2874601 RepID=UPI001CC14B67|nr:aminotransferase class V-fold PLP-dependent enzyme [Myxococcus sp. RHSTA-1-4]MBZ4419645.1 aminotransferase class V-fold PLP-dependent enzyme [Myxococcus sp. RHSTA-1-4]